MARGEYQIKFPQIELLDGSWKKREVISILGFGPWQALHERSMYRHALDSWRNRAALVHKSEKLGIGEKLAEYFQAFLSAAHAGKPIVD
jgi:hypothetical protein